MKYGIIILSLRDNKNKSERSIDLDDKYKKFLDYNKNKSSNY